ncbi:MAG: thioredoxin family protein [Geminicoccaceae bacterium]
MPALETPAVELGSKPPAFDLLGTDGKRYTLDDVRGPNGTLVMFICNHCPFVKAIMGKLVREANALADLGIGTVAISANDAIAYPEDSYENMQKVAAEQGFPFPYLYDDTQEVAKAYGAVCTPDFFGYNADDTLQYRGRLDESRRDHVPDAKRELYEAMKQIAETGVGPAQQVPSIGCSIKWRDAA